MEVIEGDGGYRLEDNPAYMKGLSGDGGYRLGDNPAYVESSEVKGEDNSDYVESTGHDVDYIDYI